MVFSWYVAQTKPNSERAAARRLDDQAFATYCPMLSVRIAEGGRMFERKLPLFRGYLFVSLELDAMLDPSERWKAVNSTRAVMTLLPRSDAPIAVRTSDVEGLLEAEHAGLFRAGGVAKGDRLRVFRGQLAGQVLECIEAKDDTVKALWSCMGRQVIVSIPAADVTVA